MANIALFKRIEVGTLLEKARVNSYDNLYKTKEALAKALKISKDKLNKIENGDCEPDLRVAAEWCKLTGHHEVWQAIENVYQLEPFAVPPIHPEFNQSYANASINLRKQLKEALKALDELDELHQSNRRPGKAIDARPFVGPSKQIADIGPAQETFFIAMERECGLRMEEVARIWTQDAVAKGIVMPKVDVEKELAIVR
jgi:DNA-binding XRE family transcriptional regulator